jgi:hypothetical protein
MKSPRTFLNPVEEAGCRMAGITGTRSGILLLSENEAANLAIAAKLRAFDLAVPEIKEAVNNVAGRIERRYYPTEPKIDREGYFIRYVSGVGILVRTDESILAAQAFYNKK